MIIGREFEQQQLTKLYHSKEAEFLVVYGRRRVGKTYLIREFFVQKETIFFHVTGIQEGTLKQQLKKFSEVLSETFFDGIKLAPSKDWSEAFQSFHQQLLKAKGKITIFLDEFPWMATRKSNLLSELDYYWNHYWSNMPNIILIVCGSSASWLINKIIYNRGGLHNRITRQIKLLPFSLSETQSFLISRKINLTQSHILSLYMALGGIPYYLKYVEPGLSAEQNIQKIFFESQAPLKDEFDKLFSSLFDNADHYKELVRLIAKKREGLDRTELRKSTALVSTGGRLSEKIKQLIETGFIEEYTPWGKTKGEYYKLIDEFSLFYLYWIEAEKNKKFTPDHWLIQSQLPAYYAWAGYSFEAVCMKHINKIISTLKIKTSSAVGAWRSTSTKQDEIGAQIDLLIDRHDNAITLCEIKYTKEPFVITKEYNQKLMNKIITFKNKTGSSKQIFLALISASGIKENKYSSLLIHNVVLLEDLFKNE